MTSASHVSVPQLWSVVATVLLLGTSVAHTAFTSAGCIAKKRAAQGKLQQCRAKEDAKALQGKPADLAKCATKFQEKIAKLSEQATKTGIECRFVDNGNSVTDYDTGLQWVETNNLDGVMDFNNPQDADNTYRWSVNSGALANGDAFTDYLSRLNLCTSPDGTTAAFAGFAARCDWRVPTPTELLTIVDLGAAGCGSGGACIDPIFGPTAASFFWSSVTFAGDFAIAWNVDFENGLVGNSFAKGSFFRMRGVRGGLLSP